MTVYRTVGVGGNFVNWTAAWTWLVALGALTDDYEFEQISDTTETVAFAGQADLGGHNLRFYSSNPHNGDPTKGHRIYLNGAVGPNFFTCRFENGNYSDTFHLEDLCFRKLDAVDYTMVTLGGYGDGITLYAKNLIIIGNDKTIATGLRIHRRDDRYYLSNIKITNVGHGFNAFYQLLGLTGQDHLTENFTIYDCGSGISWGAGQRWIFKNCVCAGSTLPGVDWTTIVDGTNIQLINCADSDNSIATGTASYINCRPNIIPADEFKSLNVDNPDWLKLNDGTYT